MPGVSQASIALLTTSAEVCNLGAANWSFSTFDFTLLLLALFLSKGAVLVMGNQA